MSNLQIGTLIADGRDQWCAGREAESSEPADQAVVSLPAEGVEPPTYGSEVPILTSTPQNQKGTLSGAFLGSGGWIRTTDRRVMSSNPISYTVDRRATHLRVTFRSQVVESPAHCELMCGKCTWAALDVKVEPEGRQ